MISTAVQISIIYYGLFYQASKNDPLYEAEGFKYLMFTLVLITSILFFAIMSLRIRLEMMKATVKRHSFWFRMFSCCLVKDKSAFITLHNVNALRPNEMLQSELQKVKSDTEPSFFNEQSNAHLVAGTDTGTKKHSRKDQLLLNPMEEDVVDPS